VGVSADVPNALDTFAKENHITHLLLSDFGRKMLPTYDALVTDQQSPVYRYGKRAYFILDKEGTVRYKKVMDNPLDLLKPEEVLKALKESGA
jgi:peroxiredoxin